MAESGVKVEVEATLVSPQYMGTWVPYGAVTHVEAARRLAEQLCHDVVSRGESPFGVTMVIHTRDVDANSHGVHRVTPGLKLDVVVSRGD